MKRLKRILRAKATRTALVVIGGLAVVALVLWATLEVPRMVVEHDTPTVGDATADSLAAIRQAILWIAGGLIAFVTLILSWSRYFLEQRNTELAADTNFTNRYTEAISQLGSDSRPIVLGGIYALERIAFDSPRDRATIAQVLAGYLRDRYPTNKRLSQGTSKTIKAPTRSWEDRIAAVRVLGRVTQMHDTLIDVDLGSTHLDDAQLALARLSRSNLSECNLKRANLFATELVDSNLKKADMRDATMPWADLRGADLSYANLKGADLRYADFAEATLVGVNLEGADLTDASFEGANLDNANLTGANLTDAKFIKAKFVDATLTKVNAEGALFADADLTDAKMDDAEFKGADFTKALLNDTDLHNSNLVEANLTQAALIGAQIVDTDFSRAQLPQVGLRNATVRRVVLNDTTVSEADTVDADLDDDAKGYFSERGASPAVQQSPGLDDTEARPSETVE